MVGVGIEVMMHGLIVGIFWSGLDNFKGNCYKDGVKDEVKLNMEQILELLDNMELVIFTIIIHFVLISHHYYY